MMVIADASYLTQDALMFWGSEFGDVTDELKRWLTQSVHDAQVLWGDIGRMNRARAMWMALSEAIEAKDPTNSWARNYDGLYFDSQLLALTRVVLSSKNGVSLGHLLNGFRRRPELCGTLHGHRVPDDRRGSIDPAGDREKLARLVQPLTPWRHKRIAHIERDAELDEITWEQLDHAVVGVSDIFALYAWRLTGVNYQMWVPDQPPWTNWKEVFKAPLFDSDGDPITPVASPSSGNRPRDA